MTAGKPQNASTLFLRLEGPLQSWGDNSKFVIRRTMDAPTKSGVLGLVCCAMGLSRQQACRRLPQLNELCMGVRVDRPGTLWQDYHTVGARIGILRADGAGIKYTAPTDEQQTLITRRYYLCDASFLVAMQGAAELLDEVHRALSHPRWPVFLGRKSCPPSAPLVHGDDRDVGAFGDLREALASRPWRPRLKGDERPGELGFLAEWRPTNTQPTAPAEAEVWYDVPTSFDPPVHHPRLVMRGALTADDGLYVSKEPLQRATPPPPRPRADYGNAAYRKRRKERIESDWGLCVFCKSPATTVQHVTYRRAGGDETLEDLRSLCRLCHDAVTMIEYGLGMGLDRINPEDLCWRETIVAKRDEIVRFRSLQTRRRMLAPEEVE